MDEKNARDRMITAIRNSQYRWRTAKGISKDSGVPISQILKIFEKSDMFLQAKKTNARGEHLYTTKERYKSETSLGKRLINVLTNTISE